MNKIYVLGILLILMGTIFVFADSVIAQINIEQVFQATVTARPAVVSTIVDNPLLCNNTSLLNTNNSVIMELQLQSNESSIIIILPYINKNVIYYNNLCMINNTKQINLHLVKGFLLPSTYFGILSMTSNESINDQILIFTIVRKFLIKP